MGSLAVSRHIHYFRSPARLDSGIDSIILLPNSYVEFLISSPSDCNLIWEWVLYRGNKVKMRSLGRAQIQYNWCLYKKNKSGHSDIYKGERICRHRKEMAISKSRVEAWIKPSPHHMPKESAYPYLFMNVLNSRIIDFCCSVSLDSLKRFIYLFFFHGINVLPACNPCACQVPVEAAGEHEIPWNSNYRLLWANVWVHSTELGYSARECA